MCSACHNFYPDQSSIFPFKYNRERFFIFLCTSKPKCNQFFTNITNWQLPKQDLQLASIFHILTLFSGSASASMPWKHGKSWWLHPRRVWQLDSRRPTFLSLCAVPTAPFEVPPVLPDDQGSPPFHLHQIHQSLPWDQDPGPGGVQAGQQFEVSWCGVATACFRIFAVEYHCQFWRAGNCSGGDAGFPGEGKLHFGSVEEEETGEGTREWNQGGEESYAGFQSQ